MTLLIPSNVSISPPTGQLGAVDQKAGQTEHLNNVSYCKLPSDDSKTYAIGYMKHVSDPYTPDGEEIQTGDMDGVALVAELQAGEVVYSHDRISVVIDER